MKRFPPLVAALALAFSGCAMHPAHSPRDQNAIADNSAAFDSYATKRGDDLIRMGATKDRSEADFQARVEAERRYGPRTPVDSVSWSRSTGSTSRTLTTAEIDKALGK